MRCAASASSRSIRSDELALAPAQPLAELVQRAPPVGRVRLELRARLGDDLLGGLTELLAEPEHGRALLLRPGVEALDVGADARLGLGDQLALALGEPRELRVEVLLRALEVLRPAGEAALDSALRLGEPFRERRARLAVALGDRAAPLLGEPALLLGEQRERVGAGTGEQSLQLGGARGALALDDGAELAPRPRPARRRCARCARARAAGERPPLRRARTRRARPRRARARCSARARTRSRRRPRARP